MPSNGSLGHAVKETTELRSSCSIYSPAFVGFFVVVVVFTILIDSDGILDVYFILNFMNLFAICVSSLGKCLNCLPNFFIGSFMFLLLSFESYLCILDTSPLSGMWFTNIVSQSVVHLFVFFTVSFMGKKL